MAKIDTGASVELDVNDDVFRAKLSRAGYDIGRFSKEVHQDLGRADEGFLSSLSKRAKDIKAEGRKSGESALESMLGGGMDGVLKMAGAGVVGIVVELVHVAIEKFNQAVEGATRGIEDYKSGRKGVGEITGDIAGKVPIAGDAFLAAWRTGDLLAAATGDDSWMAPDTREKRQREFAESDRSAESSVIGSGYDRLSAETESPYERKKLALEKDQHTLNEKYTGSLRANQLSNLSDDQKEVVAGKLGAAYENESSANKSKANEIVKEEGQRKAASLLAIDRQIAGQRLNIEKASAHTAGAIWLAQEHEIANNLKNQIADIDLRIKNAAKEGLKPDEIGHLMLEKDSLMQGAATSMNEQKFDFFEKLRGTRNSTSEGLLGLSGGMLGTLQGMPGGNNPAAEKMQKLLGAYEQKMSAETQFNKIINDKTGSVSAEQKKAAQNMLAAEEHNLEFMLSDKYLNAKDQIPLRLAGAEYASDRYSGVGEYAREADAASAAADPTVKDAQDMTNAFLKTLDANLSLIVTRFGKDDLHPEVPPHVH